ncbi:hypothetical protein M422DRAFT_243109 [Sphaerobolus stellatus SS14]|nr:hypothetical protein M422DRAFT_243109 [Sphaerobolus stellatus SS14]
MLNKAALCYKVRLITDHPFPEMKGYKLRFLDEAWKKAYQMIESGDVISFSSQAQKFIHGVGNTFRGSRGNDLMKTAVTQYSLAQPLDKISTNKVQDLLFDGSFTYETVFFEGDSHIMRHSQDTSATFDETRLTVLSPVPA